MTSLDRLVNAARRFLEDRTPWYDRAEEQAKQRRTEQVRKRSIQARMRAESLLAQARIERR